MTRERVPQDDLDYEVDTLTCRDGERFTGIAEERFPNGGLRFESEYRLGTLDGLTRTYWPNGEVRLETWYDYGIALRKREWYEDGSPQQDVLLDRDGVKHDHRWAEDGSSVDPYHRRGR